MTGKLTAFGRDTTGATSIEYALIASLIAIVIMAGARAIGTNLGSKYSAIATKVANPN